MTKPFYVFAIIFSVSYCNVAFSAATHCEDKSQVIFNCQIENSKKTMSVCKIGPEERDQQYLQYTFGKIGKAELVFPRDNNIQSGQFSFERHYSNLSGYIEYDLSFTVWHNKYKLYWYESGAIDGIAKNEGEISSGVHVIASNGRSTNLTCKSGATEHLADAFSTFVENVKQADEQ